MTKRNVYKLLPRKIRATTAWRDYADAIDELVGRNILDPASKISQLRDPEKIEPEYLSRLSRLLGFTLYSDYYTVEQQRFIVKSLYQYYATNGTPLFENFLAILAKFNIKMNVLWTADYHNFQRRPAGKDKYSNPSDGDWYLTPHYEIYLDGESSYEIINSEFSGALGVKTAVLGKFGLGTHLGVAERFVSAVNEELLEKMFYDLAPINLVLDRIVRGYTFVGSISIPTDALMTIRPGREYKDMLPSVSLQNGRVSAASSGILFLNGFLDLAYDKPVEISYSTRDGSLLAPTAYQSSSANITLEPGDKDFQIPVTTYATGTAGYFYVDITAISNCKIWRGTAKIVVF